MQFRIGHFLRSIGAINKRSMSISHWSEQWAQIFGSENSTGEVVNESTAMRVSTVSACIKCLSEDIAGLPKAVMKTEGDIRKKDTANRLNYKLTVRPNGDMTAYQWYFAMIAGAAGWGESYAPLTRHAGNGEVMDIGLTPPWEMYRIKLPDGTLYYKHVLTGKLYHPDDIITLRPFTLDGKTPVSIIRYNAETIGFALQAQKYRGKVFKVKPPGYLGSDHPIVESQVKEIAKYWAGHVTGGVPVAYGGLKYHPISFSPADLQLLEVSKATKIDICAMFRIPPTFLQDYDRATFHNASEQGIVYKTYTLNPFLENFAQEINAKCFPESNQRSDTPNYIYFNLNGLLQGDFKTRMEGHRTLWQMGMPLNRILSLEDMNPVEGGDESFTPMNMLPNSEREEFYKSLNAKSAPKEKGSADARSIAELLTEMGIKLQTNGHHHE